MLSRGGQQPLQRAALQAQALEEAKRPRAGEMAPTGTGQTGRRQVRVLWSQGSQMSGGAKLSWADGGQRDPGPRARLWRAMAWTLT